MYVLIMIKFLNQLVKIRQKFIDCTFAHDFFSVYARLFRQMNHLMLEKTGIDIMEKIGQRAACVKKLSRIR